ncbi:MAG: hypothetical protein A2413_16105 [Treponema sp. RIFOXYC1_FULL_61_9]|nr:MAG: hypothetical protein A2Y36_18635 [Treponema sp. GWA1_62_8]OHE67626.1 MAG: hypothetical protein A2001_19755 [Treponema sp. GWC1_61_84]OHE77147.1 MAG: hypothetical protein A2413_16105 [Treponema sp. RIFOXYC1_FULL_61_9]
MKAEKSLDRRARIQAEAERIFSRIGFTATSMQSIAQASGLAVGTLYNYFPSKTSLLFSMISDHLPALENKLAEIAKRSHKTKARERLMAAFEIYLSSFCTIDRQIWRDVLIAALGGSKEILDHIRTIDQPFIDLLIKLIGRARTDVAYQALRGFLIDYLTDPVADMTRLQTRIELLCSMLAEKNPD